MFIGKDSPLNLSLPITEEQETGKESSEGIVALDNIVAFVKESIKNSTPKISYLAQFLDQNKHLTAEQINYIITSIKRISSETEHLDKKIDLEMLQSLSSKIIEDSVDLTALANKDCVFYFLLSRHKSDIESGNYIKTLKNIYFNDIHAARIFSNHAKEIRLESNQIALIFNFLNELKMKYSREDQICDIDKIFLDILSHSNLDEAEKVGAFQELLREATSRLNEARIEDLLSTFSALKVKNDSLISNVINMLREKPKLLSSCVHYFAIQDEGWKGKLFMDCFKSATNKSDVIENLRNFTEQNYQLTLKLLHEAAQHTPSAAIGGFLSKLELKDEDIKELFLEALNNTEARHKHYVIAKLGQLNINPALKIALIEDMVENYPEDSCNVISDMGIASLDSENKHNIILTLSKQLAAQHAGKGEDRIAFLSKLLAERIPTLEFNEEELSRLAEDLIKKCPILGFCIQSIIKRLSQDKQTEICDKCDLSLVKGYITDDTTSNYFVTQIKRASAQKAFELISSDFKELLDKLPAYDLKELCFELISMPKERVKDQISKHTNNPFEIAILLLHIYPQELYNYFDTLEIKDEAFKIAIATKLIKLGYVEQVFCNLSRFGIADSQFHRFLIDQLPLARLFFYLPLSALFFKEFRQPEQYEIALKLQNDPRFDLLSCVRYLNLSSETKVKMLENAIEKEPNLLMSIASVSELSSLNISSEELSMLIEQFINKNGLISFFNFSTFHNGGNQNIIQLLDDDHKDKIVKLIAKQDWNLFISHLVEFNIKKAETLIDLAHLAHLHDITSVKQIIHAAMSGEGNIIAANIKKFNIKDSSEREEIARLIAKKDIRALIPFLANFEIDNKELLYSFATTASERDPENFCKYVEAFKLNDDQKFVFLEKIVSSYARTVAVAKNLPFFQFKPTNVIKEKLLQIAHIIYRQDPKIVEDYIQNFNLDNINQINDIEAKRIVDLIYAERLIDLEEIQFKSNPIYLEYIGRTLLKQQDDINVIYWTCHFLEKAASLHQAEGDVNKALKLRLLTNRLNLRVQNSPISNLEDQLKHPIIHSSNNTSINYGVTLSGMDSQLLKGKHFQIKDVLIDQQKKRIIDFKVAYWLADTLRLQLNNSYINALAQLLDKKVTLKTENFIYYPIEQGSYNTKSATKFEAGPVKIIDIEGLGQIQIGDSVIWGSQSNEIKIILNENASLEEMQMALSVLGLTSILLPSTPQDQKRFKINSLIHFFYPQFIAKYDRQAEYHLQPIQAVLDKLESELGTEAVKKIEDNLNNVVEFEIVEGEKHLCLNNFSSKAEQLGARALMCGIWNKNLKTAAEQLACIFRFGMISTQERYEAGLIIPGASSLDDFKENAAGRVFARLVTQKAIDQKSEISNTANLGGNIQILIHTKALNYMPYFHATDNYGANNPNSPTRSNYYYNKPGPEDFVTQNQNYWISNNEIMLKKRLSPEHFMVITYQDPRKMLVEEIERAIATKQIRADFFQGCTTLDDKIKMISAKPDDVEIAFSSLQEYDATAGTYKTLSIKDHWTVDLLALIQQELKNQHCFKSELMIIESKQYSDNITNKCNSILENREKLKIECSALAGKFKILESGDYKGDIYVQCLDGIKNHLKTLSNTELSSFVTPEIKNKIIELQNQCEKHLTSIDFSGQDSLNRELLTSDWNSALRDPNIILALFAIEELNTRDPNHQDQSIQFETILRYSPVQRSIPLCLYKGLQDQHPIILEKLPINIDFKGTLPEIFCMEDYIRRSHIENTFYPVLKSIELAYKKLGLKSESLTRRASKFDQPYSPEKWASEYGDLTKEVLTRIEQTPETQLFDLMAKQYTPSDLRQQVHYGLSSLLKQEGVKAEDFTKEQLVRLISRSSSALLNPSVTHMFYDRIHFTAALTCTSNTIQTKDGPLSMKDLFLGIMDDFKKQVDEENAIAAEQFYIRLLMIYETLTNPSNK